MLCSIRCIRSKSMLQQNSLNPHTFHYISTRDFEWDTIISLHRSSIMQSFREPHTPYEREREEERKKTSMHVLLWLTKPTRKSRQHLENIWQNFAVLAHCKYVCRAFAISSEKWASKQYFRLVLCLAHAKVPNECRTKSPHILINFCIFSRNQKELKRSARAEDNICIRTEAVEVLCNAPSYISVFASQFALIIIIITETISFPLITVTINFALIAITMNPIKANYSTDVRQY